MSATSRAYQKLSSWSRRNLRRRRRLADKSRRSRRGTLEPLELCLLLTNTPPWPETASDRFDQTVAAPLPGANADSLSPAHVAAIDGPAPVTEAIEFHDLESQI